ncbi:MAG: glucose-6-phosphate isomerase [Planctomycetota bacterium]|nr:glucose-6-phosphate isomerase [Planctomycetota bacterium]
MTRLRLDYANCLTDRVGEHGLSPNLLNDAEPVMNTLTHRLNQSKGTGWERWRDLPFGEFRQSHVKQVKAIVEQVGPNIENLIVLGIGGSALGNISLHNALLPATYNLQPSDLRSGPRVFVLDNVDPGYVGQTLAEVRRTDPDFKNTIVNVISKSGETAETASQFMILRSMLRNALGENHAARIVAITDPSQGTMRSICDDEGYTTLPVPEGVGGRFSVLSPVGLFSAAMCGIDIEALLDGAAEMDGRCSEPDLKKNPAAMLALLLMELTKKGKTNHVLMPYCNALYSLADWFRQLWAESLGKRVDVDGNEVFAGATPIKALGTTDQHSQIQLYRDGPNDKVIGFIEIEQFENDVTIPSGLGVESLAYLEGATLGQLLMAEKRATEFALVESQRPNFTITFPKLDAHCVGQFIQLWEITTAYSGLMLNIDAYDQPAVETGKVATFGLMGREGFRDWKSNVEKALGTSDNVIV